MSKKSGGLLLVLLIFLASGVAQAHSTYSGSVNRSEQLRYSSSSKYSLAITHMHNQWDARDCKWSSSCNGVDVIKVATGSTRELSIFDYSSCGTTTLGFYRSSTTPDQVQMNKCRLDRYGSHQHKRTATHEMGHATGVTHPPCTSTYKANSIMVQSSCSNTYNTIRPHDDTDYYNKYIR